MAIAKPTMGVYYNQSPSEYAKQLAQYNYEQGKRGADVVWIDQTYGSQSYENVMTPGTYEYKRFNPDAQIVNQTNLAKAKQQFKAATGKDLTGDGLNVVTQHLFNGNTPEQALLNLGNLTNYVKFSSDYTGTASPASSSGTVSVQGGPTSSPVQTTGMVTVTSPSGEMRQVQASQAGGFTNSGWTVSQPTSSASTSSGTTSSPTTDGMVQIKSPSGETRNVQSSQVGGFTNSGWTVVQSPTSTLTGTGTPSSGTASYDFTNFSDLPFSISNSAEWQGLTQEQKTLAYFTYKAQTATNPAQSADAQAALTQAMKLADPYFKEQIRMAQDEINRNVSSSSADVQSKVTAAQDRIDQLQQDLTFNKDQLSLEQQAELSQQLQKNKTDLFNLQQQSAEAGLAFSSPRQQAESNLSAEQQGIAESTQRKYARLNRTEDLNASRGTQQQQQNIADYNRTQQTNLTDIQRAGEAKLGTANTPTVQGVTPLGGITGTLDETKQGQIINLQNVLLQRANPFDFSKSS